MENPEIERIQGAYLARLRAMLRRAPADIREDAVREVQSHIEDEWQALGGDLPALVTVLERLGPPDEYGRDLAVQLMITRGRGRRSLKMLLLAAFFWASTSIIGLIVVPCAAFTLGFGVAMAAVAVMRLIGYPMMLIDANYFQFLGFHAERLVFPPPGWTPASIALVGLLPMLVFFFGLFRFFTGWARSRLAARGLEMVTHQPAETLPRGWERRAVLAIAVFAGLGLTGCMLFSVLGELVPVGHPGSMSLPEDFFRTPLTVLAFLSMLVFLSAPVLGLLWAARRRFHNK